MNRALKARVSESGRLSLPAEMRREIGLEKGGPVRIDLVDGTIRIRTLNEIRDHVRSVARDTGLLERASVADFLSQRLAERQKENGGSKR